MTEARRTGASVAIKGLTPLIDTVFLLLFALLTLSESRTSNRKELLQVRLPEVESGENASAPAGKAVVLEIDESSTLRLRGEGRPLSSHEELDRALVATLGDAVPEEVVTEIQADTNAHHGVVVGLLQHLRLRGFVNVRLIAVGAPTDVAGGAR